ncbi:hypothetical protein [Paenibacillus sp. YN15]|uniref:hypothetical protein n=1 Tax=Paenibacillus sp. YN15 TaxID=1742774 RepID=UPI000DD9FE8A|nr:hypothetical protein [Paenibacillus sp. YN15]
MDIIAKPLLEAAAQTLVGVLGGCAFDKIKGKIFKTNTFDGAFDLWQRGIHCKNIDIGDTLAFDGLISPYVQLFPRDPYTNAERWNQLYSFPGKISAEDFSNLEFYAGSDDALRTGPINGETLVGLYNRYGYIGEGILGVVPTKTLLKKVPEFFNKSYFGTRVRIKGTLAKCPAQHGFVAQGMFLKAGIQFQQDSYSEIPYVKIDSIQLYNNEMDRISSLLGSPWAATNDKKNPYLVQYGYFSNQREINNCLKNIYTSPKWDSVRVYYDTLTSPTPSISFTSQFIY